MRPLLRRLEVSPMNIEDVRIEDGRLVLKGGGREFSLPDGVYRRLEGESVAIHGGRIISALPPIDLNTATTDELKARAKDLSEQLLTVGDDAQLANVDMQKMLQKQQQTMQMMSSIARLLHDTAMSIIRKIGG
jgi:hypothetical protein